MNEADCYQFDWLLTCTVSLKVHSLSPQSQGKLHLFYVTDTEQYFSYTLQQESWGILVHRFPIKYKRIVLSHSELFVISA